MKVALVGLLGVVAWVLPIVIAAVEENDEPRQLFFRMPGFTLSDMGKGDQSSKDDQDPFDQDGVPVPAPSGTTTPPPVYAVGEPDFTPYPTVDDRNGRDRFPVNAPSTIGGQDGAPVVASPGGGGGGGGGSRPVDVPSLGVPIDEPTFVGGGDGDDDASPTAEPGVTTGTGGRLPGRGEYFDVPTAGETDGPVASPVVGGDEPTVGGGGDEAPAASPTGGGDGAGAPTVGGLGGGDDTPVASPTVGGVDGGNVPTVGGGDSPVEAPSTADGDAPTVGSSPTTSDGGDGSSPIDSPLPVGDRDDRLAMVVTMCGMTADERSIMLRSGLSAISDPVLMETSGTPQYFALFWLDMIDEAILCPDAPNIIQRYIVALVYFALNGPDWYQCSAESVGIIGPCDIVGRRWLDVRIECRWYGISCANEVVTGISLKNNNLAGELPSEIFSLPSLRALSLDHNKNIGGTIPAAIANAPLVVLELDDNALVGSIPDTIYNMTTLKAIDLNANQLTGTISDEIGNLVSLMVLQVEDNLLTGMIPAAGLASLDDVRKYSMLECWAVVDHSSLIPSSSQSW